MSILKNLKKVHAAIVLERFNNNTSQISTALNAAAVKALTGGMGSDAWKSYMAVFADNAAQLERLTVVKQTDPDYLPQLRAYMVSNAICDIQTNGQTGNRVDTRIDGDPASGEAILSEAPDDVPAQFRPAALRDINVP